MHRPSPSPLVRLPANTYFGMYAGFVRESDDKRGRLKCYCPEIMGEIDSKDYWLDWALPSFPWLSNKGVGTSGKAGYVPKKDGDWGVWLQFRQGDVRYPIWTGVFPVKDLDFDKLEMEANSATFTIDGDIKSIPKSGSKVILAGSDHPAPKFDTFEQDLSQFLTTLLTALQVGTQGGPFAQQLVAVNSAMATLQVFITNLGAGTYESVDVVNK